MHWMVYALWALSTVLSITVGVLVKLLFYHLAHLREDIRDLRQLMVDHLKDHSHK